MTLNKSSLFLSLLSLLLFSGCNDPLEKPAATSLPPVEVEVETLALSEVPIQVELNFLLISDLTGSPDQRCSFLSANRKNVCRCNLR